MRAPVTNGAMPVAGSAQRSLTVLPDLYQNGYAGDIIWSAYVSDWFDDKSPDGEADFEVFKDGFSKVRGNFTWSGYSGNTGKRGEENCEVGDWWLSEFAIRAGHGSDAETTPVVQVTDCSESRNASEGDDSQHVGVEDYLAIGGEALMQALRNRSCDPKRDERCKKDRQPRKGEPPPTIVH
jgi:hypothetical protein